MADQLQQDLVQVLRELRRELRAKLVEITRNDQKHSGIVAHLRPLGGDEYLRVVLGDSTPEGVDVPWMLERTARQLRTIGRMANVNALPELVASESAADPKQLTLQRIAEFLHALAAQQKVNTAILMLRGTVVATSSPLAPAEQLRLEWISVKLANTKREASSHVQLELADAYATTFWYHAALVLLVDEGYAVDFVRHRCKLVAAELSLLLPTLLDEPPSPAAIRPV